MRKKKSEMITGNQQLVKSINSNLILNLVRTKGPISGADLAKLTGMRAATVQNILRNLQKAGFVKTIGIGTSTKMGGRRPTLWNLYEDYGFVIGIQLVINDVRAVLVNLKSEIVDEFSLTTRRFNKVNDVEEIVQTVIKRVLDRNDIAAKKLLGVGIGVSGLVDNSTGSIIQTSLLANHSDPIELGQALKKHKLRVYVENDANAAVLAEKWFGKGKIYENVVSVLPVIDRDAFGLGFGFVFKKEIYRGANMFAGETGAPDLNLSKILRDFCHVKEDKIEISGRRIKLEELDLDDLISGLDEGNEIAVDFFRQTARLISGEVVRVINLLDPDIIILCGAVVNAGEAVMRPLREAIEANSLLYSRRKLKIESSSLVGKSVPLGAAALILQKIFQNPDLPVHQTGAV